MHLSRNSVSCVSYNPQYNNVLFWPTLYLPTDVWMAYIAAVYLVAHDLPVDEYSGADGVGDAAEARPAVAGQALGGAAGRRARERLSQPVTHLVRHRLGLDASQLIVVVVVLRCRVHAPETRRSVGQ